MRPEWSHKTFNAAKDLLRQAIALDPLNARARRELAYLAVIGWVFRFDDPPEPPQEITAQAAKAVQLDPADARAHPDQQAIHAYIEYIPVSGQLGRKQEAQENWRKLLADAPGWTAESFEAWYHLWNMRDEDIAKLMDGVTKSGVLQAEAKPSH